MRRIFSMSYLSEPANAERENRPTFSFHVLIALHETELLNVSHAHAFPSVEREPMLIVQYAE